MYHRRMLKKNTQLPYKMPHHERLSLCAGVIAAFSVYIRARTDEKVGSIVASVVKLEPCAVSLGASLSDGCHHCVVMPLPDVEEADRAGFLPGVDLRGRSNQHGWEAERPRRV